MDSTLSSTTPVVGSDDENTISVPSFFCEFDSLQGHLATRNWLEQARQQDPQEWKVLPIMSKDGSHLSTSNESRNVSKSKAVPQANSTPVKSNVQAGFSGAMPVFKSTQKSVSFENIACLPEISRHRFVVPASSQECHPPRLNKRKSISMQDLSERQRDKQRCIDSHKTSLIINNIRLKCLIVDSILMLKQLEIADPPSSIKNYLGMVGEKFMRIVVDVLSKSFNVKFGKTKDEQIRIIMHLLKAWKCPMLVSRLQFLTPLSSSYVKSNTLLLHWICLRVCKNLEIEDATQPSDHEKIVIETMQRIFKDFRHGDGTYNAKEFYQRELCKLAYGGEIHNNYELRLQKQKLEIEVRQLELESKKRKKKKGQQKKNQQRKK